MEVVDVRLLNVSPPPPPVGRRRREDANDLASREMCLPSAPERGGADLACIQLNVLPIGSASQREFKTTLASRIRNHA